MGILFLWAERPERRKRRERRIRKKLYALYALYRNPQTHMTSLFLGTQKGEVRSILNVCEELRLAV